MRLQEYQAKSLYAQTGIPIPRGAVAATPEEARRLAQVFGGAVAVKAQVLVGGRGKAGGIRLANTPQAAEEAAAAILGMEVSGLPVRKVLVEEAVAVRQEIYLGLVIDRAIRRVVMMASGEGGVEIEQVARDHPEAMGTVVVDPLRGLSSAQALSLAQGIGLADELGPAFDEIAHKLYEVFTSRDALLAEINPLVITAGEKLLALDAKMVLDDNALFRHPDLVQLQADEASGGEAVGDETLSEQEAREAGLSYVHLGGEIGCVVNGAGLAMATMDVIKLFGGAPANFLDVGGGADAGRVAVALRLVLGTPGIKAVLINIFGGITLCDEVARGIVSALDQATAVDPNGLPAYMPPAHMPPAPVPMVVRLVGTNEEQGHEILNRSGHRLIVANTLAEAARKVVAVAGGKIKA